MLFAESAPEIGNGSGSGKLGGDFRSEKVAQATEAEDSKAHENKIAASDRNGGERDLTFASLQHLIEACCRDAEVWDYCLFTTRFSWMFCVVVPDAAVTMT